jgi:hypothetical protein
MQGNNSHHVLYIPKAIEDADIFFPRLRDEVNWHEVIWGKTKRKLPRLCATNSEQTDIGKLILLWLTSYFEVNFGVVVKIHGVFGNYYRNGNDYLPHHRDQYDDHHVVSVSFGASRHFAFKSGASRSDKASNTGSDEGDIKNLAYDLASGDIIVFDPHMNKYYTHGIGKKISVKEGRINLTIFVTFDKLPYGLETGGQLSSLDAFAAGLL